MKSLIVLIFFLFVALAVFLIIKLKKSKIELWIKNLVWFSFAGLYTAFTVSFIDVLTKNSDIEFNIIEFLFLIPFCSLILWCLDGVVNDGLFKNKQNETTILKNETIGLIEKRISELITADIEFCKTRWSSESSDLEKKIARDFSNNVSFAKNELEVILKQIKNNQNG